METQTLFSRLLSSTLPSFLVLISTVAAMPASAEPTTEEWHRCWSVGTTIPAQERVENCTQLIERGKNGEFSSKLLAVAYSDRGIAYNGLGDPDKAIADYDEAIKLNPGLDVAYFNRGNAFGKKGEYTAAVADYTRSIEIAPDVAGYCNRAWTYEKLGQPEKAIDDYRSALKLDPDSAVASKALKRLGVEP